MFALFSLFTPGAHAEDLYVSSNERGAAILLNGVDTGYTTPATIPGVKPGQALVTVEGGCSRGEAVVDVLKGLTTRVSIVATEQLGTLTVVPVPATARLELDSASFQGVPGVPLAVSCGEHTVRASLDGHVPAIVTVTVDMGQDLTVPINLQKLGLGMLELSVAPRSATIYVDGKPVGSDAVTLPSVYQGVHTISAELDGYQPAKKQVVVEDGSTQAFHFELARASQKRQSTVTKLGGDPEPATAGRSVARAVEVPAEEEPTLLAVLDTDDIEALERAADEKDAREAAERAAREAEEREAEEREAEEREAERRAAERDRKDADRQVRGSSSSTAVRVDREPKPVGKTIAGISLLAAGAGGGVYSFLAYDRAALAYEAYSAKIEGAGGDRQRQRLADEYYDENVAPRQTLFYGSAIGTGLFLAGGVVVLVVDERAPTLVPAPGGGMLLWSGRF